MPTLPALAGAKAKAKAKSLKEKALAWKKLELEEKDEGEEKDGGAEEGEEEAVKEDDPEVEAKEKRNYGKARKFARAIQAGEIPEDIKDMYNNASKYSNQPRLFKTDFSRKPPRGSLSFAMMNLLLQAGSPTKIQSLQLLILWVSPTWSYYGRPSKVRSMQ